MDTILSEDELDSEDSSGKGHVGFLELIIILLYFVISDSDVPSSRITGTAQSHPVSLPFSRPSISPSLTSPSSSEEAAQQLSMIWNGM